jgi:hypothetical protein
MYRPDERLFVFRARRAAGGAVVTEGLSPRYTAITLIGLAGEDAATASAVLAGHGLEDVCDRLIRDVGRAANLGDVALTAWAAWAVGYRDRKPAWDRLAELRPAEAPHPIVELSWTLSALSLDGDTSLAELRERVARRLVTAFDARSGIFPHGVGPHGAGLRSHVSCFADLIYPIQALAHYGAVSGDAAVLDVASRCARLTCRRQGPAGQWWWHYDRRTGAIVERYPVYAVHQDAMAPMALFALGEATGADYATPIQSGLGWLAAAPELRGGSLIDDASGLVWRKVARREPGKLSRYAQAVASRVHPGLRVPGLDAAFPPVAIDHEDRPYHLGWLLHAWPPARAARWDAEAAAR